MTARAARLASLATATLLLLSLLAPELRLARGFDKLGGRLGIQERHLRVFNNFADAPTNNNVTPDPNFPGYTGAELAIWKAAVEWGTGHGDGSGDPTQATLGDGMADFDPAWMGNAGGVGTTEDNVASAIGSCTEGLLAYTETGFTDGWRIRFCDTRTWADGPGNVNQLSYDLQGVMVHEYGHALGLAHSTTSGASMVASTGPSNEAARCALWTQLLPLVEAAPDSDMVAALEFFEIENQRLLRNFHFFYIKIRKNVFGKIT